MIKLLEGFPDDVLAVEGGGDITGEEYRAVLLPAALEKMKRQKRLRVFCSLGAEFKAFAPGAMWEDTKLLVGHWAEWNRVALVNDVVWIGEATRMFSPFFPHPVRVFVNGDFAKAKSWISEPEAA